MKVRLIHGIILDCDRKVSEPAEEYLGKGDTDKTAARSNTARVSVVV